MLAKEIGVKCFWCGSSQSTRSDKGIDVEQYFEDIKKQGWFEKRIHWFNKRTAWCCGWCHLK